MFQTISSEYLLFFVFSFFIALIVTSVFFFLLFVLLKDIKNSISSNKKSSQNETSKFSTEFLVDVLSDPDYKCVVTKKNENIYTVKTFVNGFESELRFSEENSNELLFVTAGFKNIKLKAKNKDNHFDSSSFDFILYALTDTKMIQTLRSLVLKNLPETNHKFFDVHMMPRKAN